MNDISIQVALDFSECTKEQKEVFFNHLNSIEWKPVNPNKLWITNFTDETDDKKNVFIIEKELMLAKEISNLYELDYAIITKQDIYFNQLN